MELYSLCGPAKTTISAIAGRAGGMRLVGSGSAGFWPGQVIARIPGRALRRSEGCVLAHFARHPTLTGDGRGMFCGVG
ncbi:hypothetical protein [Thalassospira sp.]|uniref:hypothetical protein n=1 Tax=Thalassospira sp. TaxID=1912094 RepID=UPI002734A14E|nr:hypothetical protein [Thalassospira sp.]MDP2697656.1 hypothetical protein [Thalassospira sp.]